jgi:hypothetical protein
MARPKKIVEAPTNNSESQNNKSDKSSGEENNKPPIEKKSKKRGRKPKDKFNFDTSIVNLNDIPEQVDEAVIVKLPLSVLNVANESFQIDNYVSNQDFSSSQKEIEPTSIDDIDDKKSKSKHKKIKKYGISATVNLGDDLDKINKPDSDAIINFNKKINIDTRNEKFEKKEEPKLLRQIDILLQTKYQNETKLDLLIQFANYTDRELITSTDVNCFWCCHPFDNTPWGVPTKYVNDKFHVFGVFCSANCTASYIFNEMRDENIWELYSLLNLIYYKVHGDFIKITSAPDKICLKKFGGQLTIEEYRKNLVEKKSAYIIKFPPMISVIPVMEEINLKRLQSIDTSNKPVDLRLKRLHPLRNRATLDSML